MTIGFTGTQRGMTDAQKDGVRSILMELIGWGEERFDHGDCEGADATWATIRYARRVGIPRHIILPDGSRTHEVI